MSVVESDAKGRMPTPKKMDLRKTRAIFGSYFLFVAEAYRG
jgi:hypothetical protein